MKYAKLSSDLPKSHQGTMEKGNGEKKKFLQFNSIRFSQDFARGKRPAAAQSE